MKVVIAPDSFKGSMTAIEAASAIEEGVKRAHPGIKTVSMPMADGGEGTMTCLVQTTGGHYEEVSVNGPLGNTVNATFGCLGHSSTCVIEMAEASGIALVDKSNLNPMEASTYGTGQLIKEALDQGYRHFILAIGGSATNDGGTGMLHALGMTFYDSTGSEITPAGKKLIDIKEIDVSDFDPRIQESTFLIASDVQNPLLGPTGATHVFGPQKGATPVMVKELEKGMENWADRVYEQTGIHLHDHPGAGAGAAGGIGGAFLAFFPAKMERGIDVVIEATQFKASLESAILVLTGEGQVDYQTASGKTPMGVAQAAKEKRVPTIVFAGSVGEGIESLYEFGVKSVHSIVDGPMTLDEAIGRASELLTKRAEQVMRTFLVSVVDGIEKVY
ncbi:glycerate kinase [Rossellomorea aquimaris]|nr:glycerate kinase [Rossellomorea aquimaris]